MARIRSSPRDSAKHSGQQWGSGYQYRPPQRIAPKLGDPWDRILPHGRRDMPPNALAELEDGIIIDGLIFPAWTRKLTQGLSNVILGVYDMNLINDTYHTVFYKDVADANKLKLSVTDSNNATVTKDTLLTAGTNRVVAVAWQNTVIFAGEDLAGIYAYDVLTDTLTTYASTPANVKYLYDLGNNIHAVYRSGSAWMDAWTVDSAPSDWAGVGAGSHVIPGRVGDVMGTGKLGESVIVMGSRGGEIVSSTGTLPAFQFSEAPAFNGTPYEHAMASANGLVYYIDYERNLTAYQLGEMIKLEMGEARFKTESPVVYYSKNLNLVVVSSDSPEEVTLFLNPNTQQWVSSFADYWSYVADSPVGGVLGQVVGYSNVDASSHERIILDMTATTYAQPKYVTGLLYLTQPIHVHYVELVHTGNLTYAPLLTVRRLLSDGSFAEDVFDESNRSDIQVLGRTARYYIDASCEGIELETTGPVETDGFYDVALVNASGNFVVDGTATGRQRAVTTPSGNLSPTSTARDYNLGEVTNEGNQGMSLDLDQWPVNVATTQIRIFARSVTSENIAA